MSLNVIHSNEIIWGKTQQRAELKLKEIANEIYTNSDNEFIIKRTKDRIETNTRKIKAVAISQSARGYRCQYSYVDKEIPIWGLFEVIHPCMEYHREKTLLDSITFY